jgi:hypothetical protein
MSSAFHITICTLQWWNEEGNDVLVADRGKDRFVRPDWACFLHHLIGAGRSGEGRDNDRTSYGKIQGVAR